MVVSLDDTLRGMVIGVRGATVKATQNETKARIQAPKRGEAGPTTVSGPDVLSVLRACCLIGRQTSASSACTCALASAAELRATLHPTSASRHVLFEAVAGDGQTAAAFVAYCLPFARVTGPTSDDLAAMLDDAAFSAGVPSQAAWATRVRAAGGDDAAFDEFYIFGAGPGTAVAVAIYDRCAALAGAGGGGAAVGAWPPPATPEAEPPPGLEPAEAARRAAVAAQEAGRLDEAADAMKRYFQQVQGSGGESSG